VEVVEGALDTAMEFQSGLYAAGRAVGFVKEGTQNISYFASPYISQHAILSEPDAVITVSGHNFNIAAALSMKKAGLKTAILMTESPYFADYEKTMAQAYTHVFTHERRCATGDYFGGHPSVHYLPHAYNPDVHQPEGERADPCDVFFCGSLFHERALLFADVDWTGIDFRRRGYAPGQTEQDIVDNKETAAHYRSARINLNHHRTTTNFGSGEHIAAGSADSLGPRAYEIAACGAFQLCDDSRSEMFEIFGNSLGVYEAGNPDDLSRAIRYYLDRPDLRATLAKEALEAVKPHSWTNRARQILEVLV
jgi:spore maturation protein CgeB